MCYMRTRYEEGNLAYLIHALFGFVRTSAWLYASPLHGRFLTESSSRKASHGKLHTDGRSFLSLHLTLSRLAVRCSYLFGLRSEG
ncbi:hypothetical protein POVWA2_048370 [Plasmodium ovale wallikeri]|uniref:Uncharacterized protein n=1 Tax=Plasmodium ovale wallikeri TaxID=864142 RepID=A0A1A8ZL97_PLAOA|nr:hypothetical protein POVWA2_048370 [Plasmodium ovale wallikeri]